MVLHTEAKSQSNQLIAKSFSNAMGNMTYGETSNPNIMVQVAGLDGDCVSAFDHQMQKRPQVRDLRAFYGSGGRESQARRKLLAEPTFCQLMPNCKTAV